MSMWEAMGKVIKTKQGAGCLGLWVLVVAISFIAPIFLKGDFVRVIIVFGVSAVSIEQAQKFAAMVMAYKEKNSQ